MAGVAPAATAAGDFLIDNWQSDDGLPQSSVLAIAQTPEGYLWLATYGGLARFDGVRFTVFDTSTLPGLPANRLTGLHADPTGGLWVVTEYHDLARIAVGRCRAFGPAEGVPASGVAWVGGAVAAKSPASPKSAAGLGSADPGAGLPEGLWLADTKGGLHGVRAGKLASVLAAPGFGPESRVSGVLTDGEGRLWIEQGGRLANFEAGQFHVLKTPQGKEAVVRGMCASREGGLWILTPEGLRKYGHRQWQADLGPCPYFKSHVQGMVEDTAGNLWLASYRDGLFLFRRNGTWEQFTAESGLTTSALRSLFCDREGNVWVGTDGGGLLRLKPRAWKMLTRREGLGIDAVHSISQDAQGRIWFGGGTTKPYWLDQGVVSVAIPSPVSDPMDGVFSVLAARDGAMWIGIYRGKVFRYHAGVLTEYSEREGMRAGSVRAMLEDRRGAIWVGGDSGLCRIQDGKATHYSRAEGLSAERVTALAESAGGDLFVGTREGGLNRLREGAFTVYTRRDGLPDDAIGGLYLDAEDALWIGTRSGGLSRFKAGRFTNYAVGNALPARRIGPMLEDDLGDLWLASEQGILRVSRRELDEFADGRRRSVNYVAFGRHDGLATAECAGIQPACLKARDGSVWFGTAKGAAFVDPQALGVNPLPPPVIIDEVRIDDVVITQPPAEVAGQEAASPSPATLEPPSLVTLHARERRVEFRFTGLSFTAPAKVRFRYRMEGFDPDWVGGGTTRNASYTRLPPGSYRFRVTACNNDGVWNEAGASLGLVVVPAFHQTWWFRWLALAAVAGAGAVLFQVRVSRLKQLARLRGRIAGDLHDEIGSNLGGIILLSELTQQVAALPTEARASLREINATAQRSANAMRDIVWFLNPDFDTLTDMVARMREFARTLLAGVDCEFAVPDESSARSLPLEFRRHVFFTFKEILHNIVKHASATRVTIRLEASGRRLTLRVQDNGRGFDPAAAASGHGLRSLRRRAAELGGEIALESAPGKGTIVALSVTLP